jgi:hypothetical protein
MTITRATDLANIGSGIGTIPAQPLQLGVGVTIGGAVGVITAIRFDGSGANLTTLPAANLTGTLPAINGANLTGITAGATLSAGSGDQRVVVTSLTSGTMTSAATDAELTYNSGTNTLSATTFNGALTGNVTGDTSGSSGSCSGNSATATVATNAQGLTGTPNITVGNIIGANATLSGVLTYEDVTNIDSVGLITARNGLQVLTGITTLNGQVNAGNLNVTGVVTATSFVGSGANLTGITAGVETKEGGTSKGTSQVSLNFTGATVTSSGTETTIAIAEAGISTTASSPTANTVIDIALNAAQYHELTLAAGITTINCSGGSVGESHALVLNQPSSGIATVAFTTSFLFPSGAIPSMSEGGAKVDLVSFVVKRVPVAGVGATQLLASAGLNYNF